LLKQFAFHKKAHKTKSSYQIWEEAEHWRYSSAKDYKGVDGLLKVERLW